MNNQPLKKVVGVTLLLAGAWQAVANTSAPVDHHQFLTQMAASKADAMEKTLKAALKPAMKQSGPAQSIAVCNHIAPTTEQSMANNTWEVGRTSQKWRNPNNKPDTWELQQLQFFAEQVSAGIPPKQLASTDIVTVEGKKAFRYMRPIIAKGMCLQCHGKNLASDVQSSLTTLYPYDNATGYSAGQLRGAFTVLKWLTPNDISLLNKAK